MASLTVDYVRELFTFLSSVDSRQKFLEAVDDNVQWTVANPDPQFKSCPVSGLYPSKRAFAEQSMGIIAKAMDGADNVLVVEHEPIVSGNRAVVELRAKAVDGKSLPIGKNGTRYDQRFAWVVTFSPETSKIVEVHAYLDTAMVVALLA